MAPRAPYSFPQNAECASGTCLTQLGLCQGLDEGEACEPGFPDPCAPEHYCYTAPGGAPPVCAKAISPGRPCTSSESCSSGYYCAVSPALDPTIPRCVAPFTAPTGANTTLGPWMCVSGSALMVEPGSMPGLSPDAVYTCTAGADAANATAQTGRPCNPALPPSFPGYECACARAPDSPTGGQSQLRARGDVGVASGAAAAAWQALFTCLMKAQGVVRAPCLFDSLDLTNVRYGSCGYFACTVQYQAVVAAVGAPAWQQPLVRWADVAACEVDAADAFFASVPSAPCATLPNMEEWRCVPPPQPTTVGGTSGLIAVIIIGVISGFILHIYLTRNDNPGTWPWKG
jgi:hypothetical protein